MAHSIQTLITVPHAMDEFGVVGFAETFQHTFQESGLSTRMICGTETREVRDNNRESPTLTSFWRQLQGTFVHSDLVCVDIHGGDAADPVTISSLETASPLLAYFSDCLQQQGILHRVGLATSANAVLSYLSQKTSYALMVIVPENCDAVEGIAHALVEARVLALVD